LFATLTAPPNPNLSFHNGSIKVLEGSRKGPGGVLANKRLLARTK